jgi:hypothetical protein
MIIASRLIEFEQRKIILPNLRVFCFINEHWNNLQNLSFDVD